MIVTLECEPVRKGFLRFCLAIGLGRIELHASFFSNALDDVTGAVEATLRGHPGPRAVLADPPIEYRWLFDPEPERRVRVRVLEFPDYPSGQRDEEGRTLIDATCGMVALGEAVTSCLSKLEGTYGAEGFEDLTKMDLPVHRRKAIEGLLASAST